MTLVIRSMVPKPRKSDYLSYIERTVANVVATCRMLGELLGLERLKEVPALLLVDGISMPLNLQLSGLRGGQALEFS